MESSNENRNYKVIFAGLDYNVFTLLHNEPQIKIAGVNFIEDFLTYRTSNIADLLFKQVYRLRVSERNYFLEQSLLSIYNSVSTFSSELYRRYSDYLNELSDSRIPIIDLSNVKKSFSFINSHSIDSLVISNWWILPDEIIYAPKHKTVNIHPSELPKYRGSVPTLWAIRNNEPEIAVSFMVIDSSVDGGDIISQHKFSVQENDNSIDVENKSDEIIREYFIPDFLKYMRGEIILQKQDKSKASKTPKYYSYMEIDWETEKGRDIANKIKLYPYLWPIDKCYTLESSRKIKFHNANVQANENVKKQPGSYWVEGKRLLVQASDSCVEMTLFKDMSFKDSILYILKRKGEFNK